MAAVHRLSQTIGLNLFLTKTTGCIVTKLQRNDPQVVSFQLCSKNLISCRILVAMATRMKNFKIVYVKNYWSDFQNILYKWSLDDPLPKLFKLFDWLEGMAARGLGQFFLCLYTETFKIFL